MKNMDVKKKKILVLTSSFPRASDDWWARYVLYIYLYLPKDKYAITVLAPHSPGAHFREMMGEIRVIRFPYFYPFSLQKITSGTGSLHNDKSLLSKVQVASLVICEIFFFLLELLKEEYDLVHAHWILPQGLVAYLGKAFFGIPYIITVHGSDIFGLQKFSILKKIALNHSKLITVNSHATLSEVQVLSPSADVVLIPMGIDVELFNLGKREISVRARNVNLVAVGRLIIWKGFDYLIRAVPLILEKEKNVRLTIVGSGPEKDSLISLAKKLGVSRAIFFVGNLSQKDLSLLLRESDIFIASAITNTRTGEREGQGLAIIEAMATGLPVVVTKSGGIQYLVEDGKTGLVVQEKDPHAIAEKVGYLLHDETLKKRLGSSAAKKVQSVFSAETISQKFATIFSTT